MKKSHVRIFIYFLISMFVLQGSIRAEQQTWSLTDGTSFEGELVRMFAGDVAFKNPRGKVTKIPLERFSQESRKLIELEHPPELSFNIIKDTGTITFPTGISEDTQRPSEKRGHYGVRVKQMSAGQYNYELSLELYIIGTERLGNKLILLDQQVTSLFLTEEDKRQFEFRSEHEVVLRNYVVSNEPRGETYFGYLVIVKDERGKIISVDNSHDFLFENINNLSERKVGNFMNKVCVREFPTRPAFLY